MVDYEDYIIRMDELDQKPPAEEPEDGKKVARLRSFLGRHLRKKLVVDFSQDSHSSFTPMPTYKRPYVDESETHQSNKAYRKIK